jgi:hypothetical protein
MVAMAVLDATSSHRTKTVYHRIFELHRHILHNSEIHPQASNIIPEPYNMLDLPDSLRYPMQKWDLLDRVWKLCRWIVRFVHRGMAFTVEACHILTYSY